MKDSPWSNRKYHNECLYCKTVFTTACSVNNYCNEDCAFRDKYVIDKLTGCYNWTGHIGIGGTINFKSGGKIFTAPRFAYMRYIGEVPKGQFIIRTCENMICVNPQHLELCVNANGRKYR